MHYARWKAHGDPTAKFTNYGSGRYIRDDGYVKVRPLQLPHPRADKDGYALEHVLVMEDHLGRSLLPRETPHHLNGVRDDNRPENLELWSRSHPSGQRVEDKIAWCVEFLEQYGYQVTPPAT